MAGVQDLWIGTKKSVPNMMSKRNRRDSTEGNLQRGTMPLGIFQAKKKIGRSLNKKFKKKTHQGISKESFRQEGKCQPKKKSTHWISPPEKESTHWIGFRCPGSGDHNKYNSNPGNLI